MISLNTRINDLEFPKGCKTIPSALKRSGFATLREVRDAAKKPEWKWPGVGAIRWKLISNWFKKCVDMEES